MKTEYRVMNGRKARGVPKNFSVEERAKRAERMRAISHLGSAVIARRAAAVKERKAEIKRLVKAAAEAGVFVPIQEGE